MTLTCAVVNFSSPVVEMRIRYGVNDGPRIASASRERAEEVASALGSFSLRELI